MNASIYMRRTTGVCLFLSLGLILSCKTEIEEPMTLEDSDLTAKGGKSTVSAIYSSRSVNWDNYANDTYTASEAAADFGNISGWDETNMSTSNGTARIKILKNALTSASGMVANVDITDGSEYEVQFNVKFHSQFDWSRGGKVGFGFRIGEGNTGCDKADDGNGGSARMMWYTSSTGNTRFKPYLYYKDMPDNCGSGFNSAYPSTGNIQKETWYTIKIYVKSNTGTNTDGHVRYIVNGTTVLDQAIRWTTNDAQRLIKTLAFSTFRGGSTSDWQSSTDGFIYFDNLSWTKIN
jgi:hypothetical protein